ncbi:MAG: hypothetical protein OEW27_18930 [Aquincola sp.]|nr:hypothetical protein [Aquincola sp.]MDH5332023.1 hypothetical protein [Aquincola sp.]
MKRLLRWVLGLGALSLVFSLLVATVGIAWLRAEMPAQELMFNEEIVLARDLGAAHWAMAVAGLCVAMMVLLTVLPLTLAFMAIVAGGALVLALAFALAGLAWATAPVWVAIALVWWLLRRRRLRQSGVVAS